MHSGWSRMCQPYITLTDNVNIDGKSTNIVNSNPHTVQCYIDSYYLSY